MEPNPHPIAGGSFPRLYHATPDDPGVAVIAEEVAQFFGAYVTSAVTVRNVRDDVRADIRRRYADIEPTQYWWRGGERVVVQRTADGRFLVIERNDVGALRVASFSAHAAKRHLRLVRDEAGRPVPAIDGGAIWAWWMIALSKRAGERPPVPRQDQEEAGDGTGDGTGRGTRARG